METVHNEAALRPPELEAYTSIVPGTELMEDIGQNHFVKSRDNKKVLVPQPSSNPADPLNWTTRWKLGVIASATLTIFTQILGPLAIAPIFPLLVEEFDSDLSGVEKFTGITILLLGFSNFFWVPIAHTYGRRFVLLASTSILIGSCIWRAKATSYSSFYGAAILSGVGAAPAETIEPLIVADMMFLRERGFYNTLYFATAFCSTMLGPILQGLMAQRYGWRSFWWMNAALNILSLIIMLFSLPETMYHRVNVRGSSEETHSTLTGQKPRTSGKGSLGQENAESANTLKPCVGYGNPQRHQFRLLVWNPTPWLGLAKGFCIPFRLFFVPITLWASFIVTFASNCYLMITFVQAAAFVVPPYNFGPTSIGYTNFASMIGALIGLLTAGHFSDWVSTKLTIRNGGIREPEMRIIALLPYTILMIVGNFITAFGLQYQWDWRIIVIIGFGIAGITVASLPSIAATYAVDSYKSSAGYIFVTITIVKNVYGYGISYFIGPWVMQSGYVPTFMTNMGILIFWLCLASIFWVFGKRFRTWTARSSLHRL